jgi:hypothetical protein
MEQVKRATPSEKKFLRDRLEKMHHEYRFTLRGRDDKSAKEPAEVQAARNLIKRFEAKRDAEAKERQMKTNEAYRKAFTAVEDAIAFGTLSEARAAVESFHSFKFPN